MRSGKHGIGQISHMDLYEFEFDIFRRKIVIANISPQSRKLFSVRRPDFQDIGRRAASKKNKESAHIIRSIYITREPQITINARTIICLNCSDKEVERKAAWKMFDLRSI